MSKKTVIRADLIGSKCMAAILSTVAKLEGIKSMDIDAENCTLTVVGAVDPVSIVLVLKNACLAATIVSVEDDKPKDPEPEPEPEPEKDPCQCQDDCVKAYIEACSQKVGVPGCYHSPSVPPNRYYYSECRPVPYGYGYYEESSSGRECTIL